MDTFEDYILVGEISGIFGIKGWMKIFSFTDPRENILSYSPLYMSPKGKGDWLEVKVSAGRLQGKGVVLALANVTEPDQILPLIGAELAIKSSQLKSAGENEYYWSQLIGLSVINRKGEILGRVHSLVETGAHDVLVLKNKEQKTEQLIPYVMEDIIQSIDLDNKIIQVDWELDY